jgi:hypothetical protein
MHLFGVVTAASYKPYRFGVVTATSYKTYRFIMVMVTSYKTHRFGVTAFVVQHTTVRFWALT